MTARTKKPPELRQWDSLSLVQRGVLESIADGREERDRRTLNALWRRGLTVAPADSKAQLTPLGKRVVEAARAAGRLI